MSIFTGHMPSEHEHMYVISNQRRYIDIFKMFTAQYLSSGCFELIS